MSCYLGVDIGTSGTKTVLFSSSGQKLASATEEYPLYQPENGWAEQEPMDWWNAVCASIKRVIAASRVNKDEIGGVGLSGQMHGLVMLDKDGKVLRPSILWCDQRTAAECEEITLRVGADRLIAITANPALTGFTASKILWVQKHEPHLYERCNKILLPKDFIRYMLSGEYAAEVSDASGMQLLDINQRAWSPEILEKLAIDKSLLAAVYESVAVTAKVSSSAAVQTGLRQGTPIVGGGGDQAAGAVGNGIVKEGLLSSTIGSSGVVFAHTDAPRIDKGGRVHTFCHAVPGAWHVMGVTQGAGLSLKWFRDNFCGDEIRLGKDMAIDPYVIMDKEAAAIPPGSNQLLYLPYLMGERTPHLDPKARGVFFGLSTFHNKADLIRAVMEGVTFSLRDCLEILRETGVSADEIVASGGGGKSMLWRQMQADVYRCPVVTTISDEGPALGAAILSMVGTGAYDNVPEACDAIVRKKDVTRPDDASAAVYEKQYAIYKTLYPILKTSFEQLTR